MSGSGYVHPPASRGSFTDQLLAAEAAIAAQQACCEESRAKNAEQDAALAGLNASQAAQDQKIQALEVRAAALEQKNSEQDGRISALEQKNSEQDGRISALEQKNSEQDGRISALEQKNSEQDGRISALEQNSGGSSDTLADPFAFNDVSGVAQGSTQTSNAVTVSGLGSNVSVGVSVSGGSYSKNGAAYTTAAGTVANGDTISVQHIAASAGSTAVNTTLAYGGQQDTFTSTTIADAAGSDTTPDAFTVASIGPNQDGQYFSEPKLISGINTPITVSIGEDPNNEAFTYALSIDGGPYVPSAQVSNGQSVTFSVQIATSNPSTSVATIVAGGYSTTWQVSAAGRDVTPDAFSFASVSNVPAGNTVASEPATITGINAPAPVSVTGGEYSIDGGPFTNVSGTITNGQELRLRVVSADGGATATVNVGGVTATFTASSEAAGGGGGGGGGCVTCNMWLTPTLRAGDAKAGDEILVWLHDAQQFEMQPIQAIRFSDQRTFRVHTASGHTLDCSDSTPFTLPDGRMVMLPEMLGQEVLCETPSGWQWAEVIGLKPLGIQPVALISVNDQCYAAGPESGWRVVSHNRTEVKD